MDDFSKMLYDAGINDGLEKGKAEGKAVGILEATIRFIKRTMFRDNRTIEQAMDKLDIPTKERQYYKDYLAKEI